MGILKSGLEIDIRLRYFSIFGLFIFTFNAIYLLQSPLEIDIISVLFSINLYFLIFCRILFSKRNLKVLWRLGYKIKSSVLNCCIISFLLQTAMMILIINNLLFSSDVNINSFSTVFTDNLFATTIILIVVTKGTISLLNNLRSSSKGYYLTTDIWLLFAVYLLFIDSNITNFIIGIIAITGLSYYQLIATHKGGDLYENQ